MKLPYAKLQTNRRPVRCVFAERGCTMLFCSVRCRQAGWSRFHFAGCPGNMTEDQQRAYDEFLHHDWEYRGVDYSDTAFLAFRFICVALTNVRLHRQSPELAYKPIAQLVKAPLPAFRFTYLFSKDGTDAKRKEEDGEQGGEQEYTQPSVTGEDTTDEFLSTGVALVDRVLRLTGEERFLLTVTRWSELLGAVLLNGQERSPPSNYDRLKELVQRLPCGAATMDAFEDEVRLAGKNVQHLLQSSRGQGVYTVGCLFNHSCDPNLQVVHSDAGDEMLSVVALRDIEPGEELCISYIDETLSYPERQQELYEHYLFTCRCPTCERESVAHKLGEHSEKAPSSARTFSQSP
ncbi:SET and MYND domain-containing protein [Trypanosoma conorhini]|uniref:SET and MYND domain-containing protein n=1 Tax=Trypanosoma conorhini TaxID=83891 RepID=A0A3R7PVF2_9TRYP|nr:SET and MYND domain-containing protein [Trypanosoma conorhini]RNF25779.1 SET and MYND domain-containing protein [Trypanosoma conorhini]